MPANHTLPAIENWAPRSDTQLCELRASYEVSGRVITTAVTYFGRKIPADQPIPWDWMPYPLEPPGWDEPELCVCGDCQGCVDYALSQHPVYQALEAGEECLEDL